MRVLRKSNALRHQTSHVHRNNTVMFLGLMEDMALHAPSVEDFRAVWAAAREGVARGATLAKIGAKDKLQVMRRCLAQAQEALDIQFLTQPGVISSLQRDERDNMLQVLFHACSPTLERRSGMLGLAAKQDKGINEVTSDIIRSAFNNNPQHTKTFLLSIHVVSSDAAADEVRAAKDLADRQRLDPPVPDAGQNVEEFLSGHNFSLADSDLALSATRGMAPNAKFIARDKAHGCQRTAAAWGANMLAHEGSFNH